MPSPLGQLPTFFSLRLNRHSPLSSLYTTPQNVAKPTHPKPLNPHHTQRPSPPSLCSAALKLCANAASLQQGKQLHSHVIKSGYDQAQSVLNQLLIFYTKCRELKDGLKLFDEMPVRNVVSWNVMLSGWNRNRDVGILFLRRMMGDGVKPDYITFIGLLGGLAESAKHLQQLQQLHCLIVKHMLGTNCVVGSALVDWYGKCGLVEYARRVFDGIPARDLVLWNVMVSCYGLNCMGERALGVYGLLRREGVNGDDFTFSSLLSSCGIMGGGDLGKQIHGLIVRLSFDRDVFVSSTLIDVYVKSDNLVDARRVFDGMSIRNAVCWTTLIVGYGRRGDGKETVFLLRNMLREGYGPDELTFASVLSSCANLAAINEISQVHAHAMKKGFESFLLLGNALINAYSKCGSISSAFQSFSLIKEPNLITWTSVISAYAFHGFPKQAIEVFEEMLSKGVKPDKIAFVGILAACSHGGLVDEGFHYFTSMTLDHQIVPSLEHYASLIDLLGRAGHLDRAYNIMKNMPLEPGPNVLGAFIGACKSHGNIRLAMLAAEKLFQLEPEDPASYALMSNIYAFVGRWVDVAKVRKLMNDRCAYKVPGCSWVEIGGTVHTFVSSDKSHPQAAEMYIMLELMVWEMDEGELSTFCSQFTTVENTGISYD